MITKYMNWGQEMSEKPYIRQLSILPLNTSPNWPAPMRFPFFSLSFAIKWSSKSFTPSADSYKINITYHLCIVVKLSICINGIMWNTFSWKITQSMRNQSTCSNDAVSMYKSLASISLGMLTPGAFSDNPAEWFVSHVLLILAMFYFLLSNDNLDGISCSPLDGLLISSKLLPNQSERKG